MLDHLEHVHPILKEKIARVLAAMAALGFPMMITDTVRTEAEQAALFAKGRDAAGNIADRGAILVTNADGIRKRSNHQTHGDGYGHAIDCTFTDASGRPRWIDADPWTVYGTCARSQGLKWGGDWTASGPGLRADRPHVELPNGVPETGAVHVA